jgi:hypothetical protein
VLGFDFEHKNLQILFDIKIKNVVCVCAFLGEALVLGCLLIDGKKN